jgi:hypothetical protein
VKAYELTAPTEIPSAFTSAIVYPAAGVIVKLWFVPPLTLIDPSGEIDPPEPAVAVIVYA